MISSNFFTSRHVIFDESTFPYLKFFPPLFSNSSSSSPYTLPLPILLNSTTKTPQPDTDSLVCVSTASIGDISHTSEHDVNFGVSFASNVVPSANSHVSTNIHAAPANTHPMQTRAKSGISK